jgi:hypothetical protein
MRLRPLTVRALAFGMAATVALSWASVEAQWPKQPVPANVSPTADGEPDVNAPAPRTADGKPDLSGVWRAGGGGFARGRATGFSPPGPGVYQASFFILPYVGAPRTDYGEQLFLARQATNGRDNPRGLCLPVGIMQLHVAALPARYIQTPRQLIILYEVNGERREIFTDGRSLPTNDPQPWWNGYSVGRWEDDVLVVETTHFRDGGWLDGAGNPLTDAAKMTERFRRPSYGRMEIDITIDDSKAYLRPFTVRWNQALTLGEQLIESVCLENNHFPPAPNRGKR